MHICEMRKCRMRLYSEQECAKEHFLCLRIYINRERTLSASPYDAAAYYGISVIEYGSLPRSYSTLGLVKAYMNITVWKY